MRNNKKYQWYKIANDTSEIVFPPNDLLEFMVDKKKVCLAKINGNLYACSVKCPHAGGIMANGFIDALNNVVCPLHRYKFDLNNGRNVSGEGYYLKLILYVKQEKVFTSALKKAEYFPHNAHYLYNKCQV